MKNLKVLIASVVLFWTAGVGVASAQNDSIYGLDVSITDNIMNLNFYSTYKKNDLSYIYISFFDVETGMKLCEDTEIGHYYLPEENRDSLWFYPIYDNGKAYLKNENDVCRMDIENRILDDAIKNMPLKIEVYIKTYIKAAPSRTQGIRTQSLAISNVLTFFFDPLNTSLNETINNGNYTYRYFLLSGMEVKNMPVGLTFIQATYNTQNDIVSVNKYFTEK